MTAVCVKLRPKNIEDITAVIASTGRAHGEYTKILECSGSPGKIRYKHPMLKDILDFTYGLYRLSGAGNRDFPASCGLLAWAGGPHSPRHVKEDGKGDRQGKKRIHRRRPGAGNTGAVKNGVPRDVGRQHIR
jgi:hypothetical protein